MAMEIHVVTLRVMTTCCLVRGYQCLGGNCCLHLQSIRRLHVAITQNTAQKISASIADATPRLKLERGNSHTQIRSVSTHSLTHSWT